MFEDKRYKYRNMPNLMSDTEIIEKQEDSRSFLRKFTASASFQYSRVKFPLKSSITLLEEETLKEGKVTDYYRSKYVYQKEEISTR